MVVSILIEITRDLSPNESLILVSLVNDSLGHWLELSLIYINIRRQQIVFKRGGGAKEKEAKKRKAANNALPENSSFREVDELRHALADREKLRLWYSGG